MAVLCPYPCQSDVSWSMDVDVVVHEDPDDKDADLDQLIDKMLEIQACSSCDTSHVSRSDIKVEPYDMAQDDPFHTGYRPYDPSTGATDRSHQFGYGGGAVDAGAYVSPATSQSNFNSNAYFRNPQDEQAASQFDLANRPGAPIQNPNHDTDTTHTPESEHNMLYPPFYFAATGTYYPSTNAPQAAYGNFVAWAAPTAHVGYGQDSSSLVPPTPSSHILSGRKVSPDIQRLIGGRNMVTRAHSSPDMIPALGGMNPMGHSNASHLPLSHTASNSVLPPNLMASLGHSWSLEAVGGMHFASANSLAGSESLDNPLSPISSTSRISVSRKNSDQTSPSPNSQPLSPLTPGGSAFPAMTESMRHSTELLYLSQGSNNRASGQGEQKLCIVCGDSAACQHYGVRTCEGCKGFFKRTVQKNAQYVCMGNRDCPIDKRRRNRCQYCRFQKCIQVGMVKEVVRHGSLRGRRGRLPSKTKVHTSDEPLTPPVPLITSLTRAYELSRVSDSDDTAWLCEECLPNERVVSLLAEGLQVIRGWADKVPGFSELPVCDQETLITSTFFHVFSLRLAYRSMHVTNEDSLVFERGSVVRVSSLPDEWQSWAHAVVKEAAVFKDCLQMDLSSFGCLLAFVLVHPEHLHLESVPLVDQLRSTIVNALKDHCTSSFATQRKGQYFAKLFGRVGEMQPVASAAQATLLSVRKWQVVLPANLEALLHGQ